MTSSDPVLLGIIFSDLVIREQGTGKFSMIGCFNNYRSNAFPFVVPNFYVTVIVTNVKGKFEKLEITARIEHPKSGHVLHSVAGGLRLKEGVELDGLECIEVPFPVIQCVVPEPGTYSFVVLVNNEKVGSRPFIIGSLSQTTQLE